METKTKIDEEKQTAANYIFNFYNEVQQLTHIYANYENLMLELAEKYGNQEDKISEAEKEIIKNACATIRYYTTVSFIRYSSIIVKTNAKVDPVIEQLHNSIKDKFIVMREDVRNYVIQLNSVLMNTVIKTLLENSSDVIAKLYGDKTAQE